MKRKIIIKTRDAKFNLLSFVFGATFACSLLGNSAFATAELDRQYALESVGFLRSWDNVDGLFTDYVENAYKEYFAKQSRFVVQDLSKVDDLLVHSKLGYQKAIEDPQVLAQLSRSTRSQTLIRTHVLKEGPKYRIAIEWLHAPKMTPLAVEAMVLKEPADGEALGTTQVQSQITSALDHMLSRVPFKGHVTGRDGSSVTLNIGATAGLKKGDVAVLSTLDDVKIHPLLGMIVDWHLTKTGKVEVDSVDESIAFCHVIEEEDGRQVARFQKITQIIPAPENPTTRILTDDEARKRASEEMPRLGYVSGALTPGGASRDFNSQNAGASRTGGGLGIGVKVDGEIWFTREFFADLGFGYSFWNQSQNPPNGTNTTLSGGANLSTFNLAAGYSYLVTGDFFGPKGFVKLGYQSDSYSFPADADESSGPISFKGLYLGIGGDLPIRDNFGALLDFDIGLLNSVTEGDQFQNGGASSSTSVGFQIGSYYRYTNRLTFRVTLDVTANSADFNNGNSASQKFISISPAVLYYF